MTNGKGKPTYTGRLELTIIKLEMALGEILGLLEEEWLQGDGMPKEAYPNYSNACKLLSRKQKWEGWEPVL